MAGASRAASRPRSVKHDRHVTTTYKNTAFAVTSLTDILHSEFYELQFPLLSGKEVLNLEQHTSRDCFPQNSVIFYILNTLYLSELLFGNNVQYFKEVKHILNCNSFCKQKSRATEDVAVE